MNILGLTLAFTSFMMTILSQRKRGWGANYFGAKTQLKQVLGVGLLISI
jgi:hypothetical protein